MGEEAPENLRELAAGACAGFSAWEREDLESVVFGQLVELARAKPENFPSDEGARRALARTIAVRRRADEIRREMAERRHLERYARQGEGEVGINPATREAIARGVEALDDEERVLVRLRVVEGMTLEEIETALGVAMSTVRRRLEAALEKFAREWRKGG